MASLRSEDPLYWNIDSIDYAVAVESIQEAPALEFNPEDRIDIANGLLDVLVYKKQVGLKRMAEHLQLLTRFADVPNKNVKIKDVEAKTARTKSIKLFQNIKANNDASEEISALFILAESITRETWSADSLPCEDALCSLTRIVLRHTYATLTQESSVRYFRDFYRWLGNEMEQHQHPNTVSDKSNWTCDSIMLRMTSTALSHYYEDSTEAKRVLGPVAGTIGNLRQQHCERVLKLINLPVIDRNTPRDWHDYAAKQSCLYEYSDLITGQSAGKRHRWQ